MIYFCITIVTARVAAVLITIIKVHFTAVHIATITARVAVKRSKKLAFETAACSALPPIST